MRDEARERESGTGRYNLRAATDPLGSTWSFAYDPNGNPVSTTFPDGHSTTSTYTAGQGRWQR